MEPGDLLIKRAASGDKNAFRAVIEAYQSLVFAICLNITKDRAEAENLVQETFLQVYRSLDKYQAKGFKAWIGRIATNKALDWKRSRKLEISQQILNLDDCDHLIADTQDTPLENILKKEEKEKIASLCQELPPRYSIILKKYYVLSKSYSEISVEEGISIRAVESRLYRAKKLLKEKWKEVEEHEML